MFTLILILAITGVTLAVFFYVGSMFLQGYLYTEPSDQLYWQAPAAGGVITLFLMLWCALIANSKDATPSDIPYGALHSFNARVDLFKDPATEIWVEKKNDEKKPYKRVPNPTGGKGYRYVDSTNPKRVLSDDGVLTVELVNDGEKLLFKRAPTSGADNYEYVNDQGWIMKGYGDGPSGIPSIFRWGRFWLTIFLNLGFFLAFWLCLWLLLHFQWGHALGLGVALWLVFTLSILPMLLGFAAEVAQKSNTV